MISYFSFYRVFSLSAVTDYGTNDAIRICKGSLIFLGTANHVSSVFLSFSFSKFYYQPCNILRKDMQLIIDGVIVS